MPRPAANADALARALRSLDGLSLGDAFGECFLHPRAHWTADELRDPDAPLPLPSAPWPWTDDTAMAAQLVAHLQAHGRVDPDDLAARFARTFINDPSRGYGGSVRRVLTDIYAGRPWREAALAPFGGDGSMGNGSAMRVAPLGAFFADRLDDPALILAEAEQSAIVTHPHPEGVAGAQAVALAAALACGRRAEQFAADVWTRLLAALPPSKVRRGVERAAALGVDADVADVADELGNGSRITCPDTVPTCLWLAANVGDDFEGAMAETVSIGGDIDTNCAIVGGIVALFEGITLPPDWRARRMAAPLIDL